MTTLIFGLDDLPLPCEMTPNGNGIPAAGLLTFDDAESAQSFLQELSRRTSGGVTGYTVRTLAPAELLPVVQAARQRGLTYLVRLKLHADGQTFSRHVWAKLTDVERSLAGPQALG